MFLQEWAMAMNINVSAECGRSGLMVSLRSKIIHILLIMPHCQDKKKNCLIWLDSKKTLTLRDTEIENRISGLMSCSTE